MLLYMAIGKGGNLDHPLLSNLVVFYSFDQHIAPPSCIKVELERAKNLGFIEINPTDSRVSFTQKGWGAAEEHNVTIESFTNPKFFMKLELESKAKKLADPILARQVQIKIDKLADDIDREGVFWRGPPEWGYAGWEGAPRPAAEKKEIAVGSDLKITKAPPKPRKIG